MSDFAQDYRTLSGMVEPVEIKITAMKDPGKPYIGLESMPSRGANLLGWEPASSSISTNSVFSRGDVLFGKLRPNLRKCVIAPFDGYCSTDIVVLRAKDGVDSGFAGKVFQTEKVGAAAERTAIGTKMPRTSWRHLKEVSVFCPELEEQKLTAQILDTLDTAIRETEALIDKLKAIKQGLLHDLLTRGIDTNGQLRPPQSEAPQLYKESPLGWIPKEWEVRQVQDLGEAITGSTPPSTDPLAWGQGISFITPGDIESERPISIVERQVSPRGQKYVRLLPAGSSLVVCIGSTIGKVGMTSAVACTNQQINAVVPSDGADGVFLFHALQMQAGQLRALAGLQAVPIVNKSSFESIILPIPLYEEQVGISARVSAISNRLNYESEQLEKLQQKKNGLMDDLLTGRVRVTPLLDSVQLPTAQTGA